MLADTHVLVTGGLGAIGSALTRALLQKSVARITIVDDCSSGFRELCGDILRDSRVLFIQGSIVEDEVLSNAFADAPSVVFHLAAHFANQNSVDHPVEDCLVNSLGTLRVLEHARHGNVQKFVFASSSCVYGNESSSSVNTHTLRLDTPYAVNKLHGEYFVKFYHEYHRLNTTILRYFNSFGPGEIPGRYRSVIPNFFALAMRGEPLPITGDRSITRDFNYIGNSVAGTILAAENPVSAGNTYNIGSGCETKIVDIAEAINRLTGNKAGMVFRERRTWDSIPRRFADIAKTVAELGYRPVIDFERQLAETCDWLREHEKFFHGSTGSP